MKFLKTWCLLVFWSIFSANGANAIIGGSPIGPDDLLAKSTVGIFEYYLDRVWINNCTGSVLDKRIILTAAHCLDGVTPEHLLINFSAEQIVYDSQAEITDTNKIIKLFVTRKVKSFIIHPSFNIKNRVHEHDLALILLEDEVPANAIPVNLLSEEVYK